MKTKIFIFSILSSITMFAQDLTKEARLLRFPNAYGNKIVFTYAGDLYTVSTNGGIAHKLTSAPGYEMFAKFSPDGKYIAFTGQYDGNTEVYIIPSEGGTPQRLTYTATLNRDDVADRMGPNNIVMGWTPDGKYVIFRSRMKSFNDFVGQLFKISIDGGIPEQLPLATGGFCSYSPDGKKLAFNEVFREFRTWKYYRGGMADDIRIYDFEKETVEKITNNPAQDIFPMWYKNKIFFASDRDRTMNLFSYDLNTKEVKKITNFTDYDVKFPSIGADGTIAFENAGYIYTYNPNNEELKKIHVKIMDDFRYGRLQIKDASKTIRYMSLSPDGKRVLFGARGDIFDLPAKKGVTYNLTKTSGVHERNPKYSPDGKWIAFISDQSGEFEIYIMKSDRSEPPIQLTKGADTYYYNIKWSPDSKKILWNDKKLRLRYVDINTKKVTLVDKSNIWEIHNFNWSPDSKWVVYSKKDTNKFNAIYLYNLENKKITQVTESWFNSSDPVFSDDGKYLFFTSMRNFTPTYSNVEWDAAYLDMEKIYLITLAKSTKSPLQVYYDQNSETNPDKEKTSKKEDDKNNKNITVKIDLEGINQRIDVLPIQASNYWNLHYINGKLYYNEQHYKGTNNFKVFDLNKLKEKTLATGISFVPSFDGKKFIIKKAGKYYVVDTPTEKLEINSDNQVNTNDMKVLVNIKKEWKQIFDETWRQMRDFFYMKNMHGVDWKAMHDKYAALLPYVNHRKDLTYILGEMIGELNIGHAYVGGGDVPNIRKVYLGLLGAEFEKDGSGYFKIKKILKGQNWWEDYRSPLTEIGVDVNEGDYITAINGQSTKKIDDIYKLLIGKANKYIELTVSSNANGSNPRKVVVKPIASEANLYYYNWVQNNIKKVNEATNGQVGYVHIPDMLSDGLNEFVKYFYPQLQKRAIIIDDRGNGGGNVSPIIIDRLRKAVTRANMSRDVTAPAWTPEQAFIGPKVLLINQYSASDGDLFPYGFKKHKLGKVIGVRSWGGVVGIRGPLPMIDGGYLYKPEFASYSAEKSEWIIEGHGVDPDIVVENDPHKEFLGEDQQLEKAIEVVMKELKKWPKNKVPPIPPAPDKSK